MNKKKKKKEKEKILTGNTGNSPSQSMKDFFKYEGI